MVKDCRARTNENGDPVDPKPPSKKEPVNAVTHEDGPKETTLETSNVTAKMRAAGSTIVNTIRVNNINQPLRSLITHSVRCNDVEL